MAEPLCGALVTGHLETLLAAEVLISATSEYLNFC